jgi:sugar transferase (PEP-CTERM/EpsH1 system associated)
MASAPIKILFVALDMDLGGLQRIVHLLIEGMDRKRFEPFVCCLDRGGMFYDLLAASGVEGHVLHRRPGPFDARLFINLYSYIREKQIDVIHSHNACALYAGLAGLLAGVPVMHTDHGRLVPDKRGAILEDWLASKFLRVFIGVSEELTEYLSSRVKIARDRLSTIKNGVDTVRFVPTTREQKLALRKKCGLEPDDIILGTVCRFDPIKNLPFMVSCMPQILSRVPRAKLIIVGEGATGTTLEKLIDELGLTKHISIWSRRQDIEHVMPIFDAYVCTSLSEGTSMTILEAMACGLPIIATAVGGNCSLVDQDCGFLFPVNDKEAFVSHTVSLLPDSSRLVKMGKQSRVRAEQIFPLRKTIDRYQELYLKYANG